MYVTQWASLCLAFGVDNLVESPMMKRWIALENPQQQLRWQQHLWRRSSYPQLLTQSLPCIFFMNIK